MKYKTEFLLVLSHTGNVFFFFSHFFFFWSAVKMLSLISSGNSNSDQFYETFLARAKGCGQERERGKIWTHPGFLRFGLNWKPTFFFFFSRFTSWVHRGSSHDISWESQQRFPRPRVVAVFCSVSLYGEYLGVPCSHVFTRGMVYNAAIPPLSPSQILSLVS